MIFNAQKILAKVLKKQDFKNCTIRVSESILAEFRETCLEDGAKNYGLVLEAIIKEFMAYSREGKIIKISVAIAHDRVSSSFTCLVKLWKEFIVLLPKLGLDRARTVEYLMEEYCRQRAKHK